MFEYDTRFNKKRQVALVKEKREINTPVGWDDFITPQNCIDFCESYLHMSERTEEYVYVFCLNYRNRATGYFELSHGTVNGSICMPKDIYMKALMIGASGIILVHNHPSGAVVPSNEDREITNAVKAAGDILGVPLMDHLIIGDGTYYSFKESCLLD